MIQNAAGNNDLKFVNYMMDNYAFMFDKVSLEYGTLVTNKEILLQDPRNNIDGWLKRVYYLILY